MIILPPPWEGLHPAFPKRPEPFNTNALTNATTAGGTFGLLWATGAILFRKSPHTGLKAAAWVTTLTAAAGLGSEQVIGRIYAKPYLESKGITVPRQKLLVRPFNLEEDNFIVAGGIGAVLLARSIAKPWQVTGWKRVVGAFSMGAFVGDLTNYAYHWRQIYPCAEKVAQQKAQRAQYAAELKEFRTKTIAAKYGVSIETSGSLDVSTEPGTGTTSATDVAAGKHPGSTTSMQQLLRDLQKTAEESMEKMAGNDTPHPDDDTDPQFHFSELRGGERVFRPDTNYNWNGTPAELDQHMAALQARREHLKQEAELLWHRLAVKEAAYHSSADTSDESEREVNRIALEVMNHLHINAYLEISQHDWMIADSQKKALQLKTLSQSSSTTPWIPPPPTGSDRVELKHTLLLLDELKRDTTATIEELEFVKANTMLALQSPGLEAFDRVTGKKVEDPYKATKSDLEELDRTLVEAKRMKDTIDRLKSDFGGSD